MEAETVDADLYRFVTDHVGWGDRGKCTKCGATDFERDLAAWVIALLACAVQERIARMNADSLVYIEDANKGVPQ